MLRTKPFEQKIKPAKSYSFILCFGSQSSKMDRSLQGYVLHKKAQHPERVKTVAVAVEHVCYERQPQSQTAGQVNKEEDRKEKKFFTPTHVFSQKFTSSRSNFEILSFLIALHRKHQIKWMIKEIFLTPTENKNCKTGIRQHCKEVAHKIKSCVINLTWNE